MAFGDIIGSLVFDPQEDDTRLSDNDSSGGDSSDEEENNRGLMGSFFGFIGLGKKRHRKKLNEHKKNNNNVYDYKPEYSRESSQNSTLKNFQIVRIKTLKHNGMEVEKTKQIKTFEVNSEPVICPSKQPPQEYDLDSSINESEISSEELHQNNCIKLKLKAPAKEYPVSKGLKPSSQNVLMSKLFTKTLENVFSKKISAYRSHFLSQLKLEQASRNNSNKSERTESLSNTLRSSFKSPTKRRTINSGRQSLERTIGVSTRASTIFGKKELHMIYQNNSLESLAEGESFCNDYSQKKLSHQSLDIKEGLEKLQNLMRKNDKLKIQAFYKLMSYQSETPSELLTINMDDMEPLRAREKMKILPQDPLTVKKCYRGRKAKKSYALKMKEVDYHTQLRQAINGRKQDSALKSEISKEDTELEVKSESDYAIHTLKCSTKSEIGNFQEEEEIYLVSDYEESIDLDKQESLPFDFNETQPNMLQSIELSSVGDFQEKCNSSARSSILSEDFEKDDILCKKISMNKRDIFRMTKQVEKIRKMFS
ncbi:unnamed protein product [Moneuplotes crassus]|uniref:Uncharacterized protein n=1 Tax=Euplotes crassus TaxID=5936 RepID=A0AAD1UA31_EUPCR|nr:unnamed protein product [Moneuplotes crassus]